MINVKRYEGKDVVVNANHLPLSTEEGESSGPRDQEMRKTEIPLKGKYGKIGMSPSSWSVEIGAGFSAKYLFLPVSFVLDLLVDSQYLNTTRIVIVNPPMSVHCKKYLQLLPWIFGVNRKNWTSLPQIHLILELLEVQKPGFFHARSLYRSRTLLKRIKCKAFSQEL